MGLIPLHGSAGFWDEIVCLALPATVVLGVALTILRQEQGQRDDPGAGAGENEGDRPAAEPARPAARQVREHERP